MIGPPYRSWPFSLGVNTSPLLRVWLRLAPLSNSFWPGDPLKELCRDVILESGEPYGKGENGENLGLRK